MTSIGSSPILFDRQLSQSLGQGTSSLRLISVSALIQRDLLLCCEYFKLLRPLVAEVLKAALSGVAGNGTASIEFISTQVICDYLTQPVLPPYFSFPHQSYRHSSYTSSQVHLVVVNSRPLISSSKMSFSRLIVYSHHLLHCTFANWTRGVLQRSSPLQFEWADHQY